MCEFVGNDQVDVAALCLLMIHGAFVSESLMFFLSFSTLARRGSCWSYVQETHKHRTSIGRGA